MNSDHSRLEVLLEAALERDPTERDAFLAGQCAGDEPLLAGVRRLLAAHEAAGTFLDPLSVTARTTISADSEGEPGRAPMEDIAAHFPEFEFLELLGRGGMGEVYKARQKSLDRFVAIKILPERFGKFEMYTDRFLREAQAMALLSHPNIIAVYDYGKAGPHCFLSMEFVDGVDLRRAIAAKSVEPVEALGIVRQLCDALEYAHGRGVVHRDIKPSNIMLDRAGRVRVADFGLAKIVTPKTADDKLTGVGEVLGTPAYMAPEQRFTPGNVDHRADLYSLGVVFYEMLTGELPMGKIEAPSKRVEVDVRIDEVVLRTLDREPSRRYQHASEIKSRMDEIATRATGKRWPIACGLAVLVALVALVAWPGRAPKAPPQVPPAAARPEPATIHEVAQSGTRAQVAAFLEKGTALESLDGVGRTPLLVAAWNGNTGVAEELLTRGAAIEAADPGGFTPLLCAAEFGRIDTAKLLLSRGAKRPARNKEGADALIVAAGGNGVGMVKLLLAEGFDVNSADASGHTALHAAAANGWPELLAMLLKAGANPLTPERIGNTPLHLAAIGRAQWEEADRGDQLRRRLSGAGGRVPVERGDDAAYLSCMVLLLDASSSLHAKNSEGDTALHLAARGGNLAGLKLLLERGAQAAPSDDGDYTPFELAVLEGHLEVVKALLDAPGATPPALKDRTALHLAAGTGHVDVAKLLVERQAPLNAKDGQGSTPLHWAVLNAHPDMVRYLAEVGSDLETTDKSWMTPLHLAVRTSTPQIVQILVDAGANLEARDVEYITPLQRAQQLRKTEVISLLERAGRARAKTKTDGQR